MDLFWLGGDGPQDIPEWIYAHIVTSLGIPPNKIGGLRLVQKTGLWDGQAATFFRIFDSQTQDAWRVDNFTSLDECPDLIVYEGYRLKGGDRIYLTAGTSLKPHPL
jgi:hypothetical protein